MRCLEVDVLSLSATPIPTLLSLAGLRDISVIETPPEGRRPIRTTVEYDEELVRLALEQEHAREGRAFYLHNRVETIDEAAEKLRQLCPDLRFLVAHGQMAERELERMHAFWRGTPTCSCRRRSSVRARLIPRPTRWSSSAPTRSGSPGSTRSAGVSDAPT